MASKHLVGRLRQVLRQGFKRRLQVLADLALRDRWAQGFRALHECLSGTLTERMRGPQMQCRDAGAGALEDRSTLLSRVFERGLHLLLAAGDCGARSLFRRENTIHCGCDLCVVRKVG